MVRRGHAVYGVFPATVQIRRKQHLIRKRYA
jgi:hypothetical protein